MPKSGGSRKAKRYAELTQKKCNGCLQTKETSAFYTLVKKTKNGLRIFRNLCKPCENKRHREYVEKNKERINGRRREKYHANPEKIRESGFQRKYGISIAEYNERLTQQKHRCRICNVHESEYKRRRLDVDHCHTTGKIRGLLCGDCNTTLGLMKESPARLRSAAMYLEAEE